MVNFPDELYTSWCLKEGRKYYVFKTSGTGYRKMWGGWAEKMTGYDYRYQYIFPSELKDVKSRLSEFKENTAYNCKRDSPFCPCPPYPDIWEDGSGSVEVVGEFDTYEEVEAYRCENPHYMGYTFLCNMWTVESDKTFWDEIIRICGD
jgi:hypothetical protein